MENALYVGGFEMEQKTAMKISMVSIVGNILLSLFKALAGIVANSGAMISDAIHSASDVFSTIVVIIGIRLSGKSRTKSTHMDMNAWSAWRRFFWQRFLQLPVFLSAGQR